MQYEYSFLLIALLGIVFLLHCSSETVYSISLERDVEKQKIQTMFEERAVCVLENTIQSKELPLNEFIGIITFRQEKNGVRVIADLNHGNVSDGLHGFHIHEWGDLSDSDGMASGKHYNPFNHPHNCTDSDIRHVGDMGNIAFRFEKIGRANMNQLLQLIELTGERSVIGRSVILHEKEDNCAGEAGNAGKRIGRCVIGIENIEPVINVASNDIADFPIYCNCKLRTNRVYRQGIPLPSGFVWLSQESVDSPVYIFVKLDGFESYDYLVLSSHQYGDLREQASLIGSSVWKRDHSSSTVPFHLRVMLSMSETGSVQQSQVVQSDGKSLSTLLGRSLSISTKDEKDIVAICTVGLISGSPEAIRADWEVLQSKQESQNSMKSIGWWLLIAAFSIFGVIYIYRIRSTDQYISKSSFLKGT